MRYLGRLFLWGTLMLCGCAQLKDSPSAPATTTAARKLEERNNAVSLLYDLTQDEKNVSKVLIIKSSSKELGDLIDAISQTSGDAGKRLEQMAKADPAVKLHTLELPAGEKATRDAIAKTKEHELLFSSGQNFQFQLLLTQADALSYGWHLAGIAAANSESPEEVRAFKEISVAMENLYEQVVTMLRAEARKSP